ncbi:MFS general substrate transporter [Aspergillus taichungensis]|uniref:MFS general substrate transporter n=1 Tax=Aspergillus taichungensis TaxID=482145 RepID=A0A2J5HWN1_9EURO|nr:MFS general substrate transporter [Aspergillus taichungensis]
MGEQAQPRSSIEKGASTESIHEENVDGIRVEVLQGSMGLEMARRTHPPQPWSRAMLQLYACMLVGYLCSALNGFDGSLMGALLPIPQFQETFGAGLVGSQASLIQGMYTIGGVSALPFVGFLLDNWGRRLGMFAGSVIVIVGTILGGTANNMGQLLASRFFLGWGYSMAASAAPAYVVEMSHPAYRDVLTGLYNCQYFVGAIAAAGACRGCLIYPDSRAWRIPIWCQLISSSFVVLFVWLLPESPRWLYSHGHREQAWNVITKYHGEGSRDNAYVTLQIREYEEAINTEGSDKRSWDFRELVDTKAARWRLICVGIASFMSQWAQGGVTTYYMGGLLKSAGVTDTTKVLDVNLGFTVLSAGGAYLGGFFTQRLRRRPMLLGVSVLCCLCFAGLSATTGVYSSTEQKPAATASIVIIFLIGFFYSFGWTPLQAMYSVECLAYETRAKGMAIYSVFTNIALLVNQFGIGNAMEVIDWHTYIILAGWNLIQASFIYFFAVETCQRTLEELTEIFAAPNPRKKSTEARKVLLSEETDEVLQVKEA